MKSLTQRLDQEAEKREIVLKAKQNDKSNKDGLTEKEAMEREKLDDLYFNSIKAKLAMLQNSAEDFQLREYEYVQ